MTKATQVFQKVTKKLIKVCQKFNKVCYSISNIPTTPLLAFGLLCALWVGFLFMENYLKPALTYSQQIAQLQSRGLLVDDIPHLEKILRQKNYYRISAYCIPFETKRDCFKPDIYFKDVFALYEFDRKLRVIIDEVLEIIEIAMRSRIAYHLAHQYGVFAHEDSSNFYTVYFNHNDWIDKVHKEAERSNATFVDHYKNKYLGFPRLPIWMAVEVMSFGNLSMLFKNLLSKDQIAISKQLGLNNRVAASWLHTFSFVRNVCAHHSRLWNKEISVALIMPKNTHLSGLDTKRVGSVIFAIIEMLKKLDVEQQEVDDWKAELKSLLGTSLKVDNLYKEMGLPQDILSRLV